MLELIKKRLMAFKDKTIRGEIILNIGLGIFINALFAITINQISVFVIVDLLLGLIIISEGAKQKETTWER